jgi:hypothetical protein
VPHGAELLMHIKIVRMHTDLDANESVLSNSTEVQLQLIYFENKFQLPGLAELRGVFHGMAFSFSSLFRLVIILFSGY